MIYLVQDTDNKVVLTLTEKTTISTPYYLFEFINDDSNNSKIFTGVDISTNLSRYNEFLIVLNSTEDLENSIIDLPATGFYKYNVYSTSVLNDLDINNVTELVETGKIYVEGSEQLTKVTYEEGNDTKVVYNG
jgi:YbbR domain-containing protein